MAQAASNQVVARKSALVAVAGKHGGNVDKHFGAAEVFAIYRLSSVDVEFVETRAIDELATPGEERRATIVRILGDCGFLLIEKVGEAPKKMLADAGIEAIDKYKGKEISFALAALAEERL